MIDKARMPFPDDAPEPGRCVRLERPEPGLAVLVLDPPHRSLAVLDGPLLRDLETHVATLEQDPQLRGVVITGRSPSQFAAGADVHAILALRDAAQTTELVLAVHELFRRIDRLRARVVAAAGGPVPGGAYELSLACDLIVLADDAKTRVGLPETQLGIVPAWGGCHRLARRVGVPTALEAILGGKLYEPRKALKLGLVDRLTKPEYLLRVACDVAMGREPLAQRGRGAKGILIDRNVAARAVIASQARKQVLGKTHGFYPAPLEAIGLVCGAPGTSMEDAALREAEVVAKLIVGPVSKNLISLFLGTEEQKKLGRGKGAAAPRPLARIGVLGAGVMGGAIASLAAEKGLDARLMDVASAALDRAELEHRKDVHRKLQRRALAPHEADAAIDRFERTTELLGFARCGLVIEAIAERLDVKRSVFTKLAQQCGPDTILATNTSSLSVDAIAAGVPNPERVCGMHFFNPVKKMPLVEVVRGTHTADHVVATVAALALRLGKTPIVVKDVAGFLVNRILGPYLDEALRLCVAGADLARVDRLMLAFGMPMGPFRLLDEVGLDIARHVGASLGAAYGARMAPSALLDGFATKERLGRKTGLGFYRHGRGKDDVPQLADDLAALAIGRIEMRDEEIVDRLVLTMVNEAARCLEEEVVASPRELDLATVLGTGFAPFRGGLLRYADARGLGEVRQRLDELAARPDVAARGEGAQRFTPTRLIVELAERAETFHGPRTRPAPVPVA
ncbi:MAG: enoyl-CoA hydratase/isomerase family protein [Planctomycetes bacterium]|nr:enoyl-CoA hydratase/isomerase family protein [Planctomycetota bacterium]